MRNGSSSAFSLVECRHPCNELGLPPVARMAHLLCLYPEIEERGLSIAADGDDNPRPQLLQKPNEQRAARTTLRRRVRAVREGVVRAMRMKWEDVPQENRTLKCHQRIPDYRRRSLSHRRSFGRPREWLCPKQFGMRFKVHLVGEGQSGSATSAISKITSYPKRIDPVKSGGHENEFQIFPAYRRRVLRIVDGAGICVRVEYVVKTKRRQLVYERLDATPKARPLPSECLGHAPVPHESFPATSNPASIGRLQGGARRRRDWHNGQ